MGSATYDAEVFSVSDIDAAKRIIITPSADMGTAERWEAETPYLAGLLGEAMDIRPGQLVIDYGCGIGRLAKALIERFDCMILGVDSSGDMRALATGYVDSAAFSVLSRRVLEGMAQRGLRADAAFSVSVLQHCLRPDQDIRVIASALRGAAPVSVVNLHRRAVPTVESGWIRRLGYSCASWNGAQPSEHCSP